MLGLLPAIRCDIELFRQERPAAQLAALRSKLAILGFLWVSSDSERKILTLPGSLLLKIFFISGSLSSEDLCFLQPDEFANDSPEWSGRCSSLREPLSLEIQLIRTIPHQFVPIEIRVHPTQLQWTLFCLHKHARSPLYLALSTPQSA